MPPPPFFFEALGEECIIRQGSYPPVSGLTSQAVQDGDLNEDVQKEFTQG